eukprot:COSAG01_NODE_4750_length_4766_cov_16.850043_3_plen_403_part_00
MHRPDTRVGCLPTAGLPTSGRACPSSALPLMPDDAALRFRQVFFGPARAERAAAAEPGCGFGGAAPPRAVSGSGGRESPTPQEAKHELERRQRRQRLRFQEPGVDATVRAEQLERRRQFVPSVDMGALHWHRRPDPPPPPPELTRSVRAADLVAWAQASAARAAHARARADWGASFRGYVVGAELLRMVLDDDQPRPQLRADAREKMDALLSAAETLRRAHPFQCLAEAAATPAPPLGGGTGGSEQVRQAKAWAGLDEAADEAAARHAAEENLLGNAELKAGNAAAAAEHFSRAIELAGHSSCPPPPTYTTATARWHSCGWVTSARRSTMHALPSILILCVQAGRACSLERRRAGECGCLAGWLVRCGRLRACSLVRCSTCAGDIIVRRGRTRRRRRHAKPG